jgi:hypothetical protein
MYSHTHTHTYTLVSKTKIIILDCETATNVVLEAPYQT